MVAIHLQTIPLTQLLPRSAASAEAMRVKEEKQDKKEEDGYRLWGNDETEAMKKVGAKDEEQAEVSVFHTENRMMELAADLAEQGRMIAAALADGATTSAEGATALADDATTLAEGATTPFAEEEEEEAQ